MSAAATESASSGARESALANDCPLPFMLGDWLIEPALRQARASDTVVKIEPRNLRVLQVLASRPGEIVSARDIESLAWSGFVVTPDSLYQSIRQLRQLLGDTKSPATYIETVPRRGYRLVAPVATQDAGSAHSQSDARLQIPAVTAAPIVAERNNRAWPIRVAYLSAAVAGLTATLILGAFGDSWTRSVGSSEGSDAANAAILLPTSLENLDAKSLRDLGMAARRAGRPRDSLLYLERALRIQLRNTDESNEFSVELLTDIAAAHLWLDDEDAAVAAGRRVLEHIDQLSNSARIVVACNLAEVFTSGGEYAAADRLISDLLPAVRKDFGVDHMALTGPLAAQSLLRWARGHMDEAEKVARETLRLDINARGSLNYQTAYTRILLGAILLDRGDLFESEQELRAAVDVLERTTDEGHPYRLMATHYLSEVLVRTSRFDEAEALLHAAITTLEKEEAVDWRIARAFSVLAESRMRRSKLAEAEHYLALAKSKLTKTKGWPIEREVRSLNARFEMLSALRAQSPSATKL